MAQQRIARARVVFSFVRVANRAGIDHQYSIIAAFHPPVAMAAKYKSGGYVLQLGVKVVVRRGWLIRTRRRGIRRGIDRLSEVARRAVTKQCILVLQQSQRSFGRKVAKLPHALHPELREAPAV